MTKKKFLRNIRNASKTLAFSGIVLLLLIIITIFLHSDFLFSLSIISIFLEIFLLGIISIYMGLGIIKFQSVWKGSLHFMRFLRRKNATISGIFAIMFGVFFIVLSFVILFCLYP